MTIKLRPGKLILSMIWFEFLFHIVTAVIALSLMLVPVLAFYRKPIFSKSWTFFTYNLHIIPILFILVIIYSAWGSYSKDLILLSMGYNFDGMSDVERLRSVADHLKPRANEIYQSTVGVGWPIHAMFWSILLLPYPSLIYIFRKLKNKNRS